MNRDDILKKINEIFIDIFDDETLVISNSTNADDIEEWDSLENINIILAIEKEFKIKFTIDEVSKFKNVGEIVAAIISKL